MAISVSRVGVVIGGTQILDDVTTNIPGNAITALLGPSGAGKTTLIRCLVGSLKATTGTVTINGLMVPHRKLLEQVGYMPQSDAVYTDLTARANLEFFAGLYKLSSSLTRDGIEQALHLVDLAEHADKPVGKFSGGMRRRLSLAIVLLANPDVLIIDEPTVGMDPVLRRSVWETLRGLAAAGRVVLVSTHVMEEARMCDRAVLLRDGQLVADDTVAALEANSHGEGLEHYFFAQAK